MKTQSVWRFTQTRALCGVAWLVFLMMGILNAEAGPNSIVSFNDFAAKTKNVSSSEFLGKADSRVKDAQAFEEMRQHILDLYQGVEVSHSFVLDGRYFDCVPIEQQPGVRMQGLQGIASPPPASILKQLFKDAGGTAQNHVTNPQIAGREFDEFGNSRVCEDHTVPMQRVTLEDMSRFATLRNFLEKGPNGAGQLFTEQREKHPDAAVHKYAYGYQYVSNIGQTDTLNLWSPYVNESLGEDFSLSQSWTASTSPTQTAEVGWQNYPGRWGNEKSRLFIYWTADGYQHTGCYNTECKGFVIVGSGWYLGGSFTHYSTDGGTQYVFTAMFYLYQGNWWLGLGASPDDVTWYGYYPASLYGSGTMKTHSTLLEVGGETLGSGHWPDMGSGKWASKGWTHAAYQRELYYWAYPSGSAYWDTLTTSEPAPKCYTIADPGYTDSWGVYFYFGGPGGGDCE